MNCCYGPFVQNHSKNMHPLLHAAIVVQSQRMATTAAEVKQSASKQRREITLLYSWKPRHSSKVFVLTEKAINYSNKLKTCLSSSTCVMALFLKKMYVFEREQSLPIYDFRIFVHLNSRPKTCPDGIESALMRTNKWLSALRC